MKKKSLVFILLFTLIIAGCSTVKSKQANTNSLNSNKTTDVANDNTSSSNTTANSTTSSESNVTSQSSNKISYNVYGNARFKYSIPYPSDFKEGNESDNGDGKVITSSDGSSKITVFGQNNVFNKTIQDLYNDKLKEVKNPSYKKLSSNFYIVSYLDGSTIYYEKSILSDNVICTFTIQYPKDKKESFDEIVTYISNNFKKD